MRIMLLAAPNSYRVDAFVSAAARLGIDTKLVLDLPTELAAAGMGTDFRAEDALEQLSNMAHRQLPAAVIAVDDSGSMLAAALSERLGLAHNAPQAALAARNKFVMRELLAQGAVSIPAYKLLSFDADLETLAASLHYPCVVKPLELNGSRGVIRTNDAASFLAAVRRLHALIRAIYAEQTDDTSHDPARFFLVEEYIPGVEVAIEGILDAQGLHVLALFDKPDPLEGPFFEETIYVTPSRLPEATQQAITACAAQAARALGLRCGPIHAELRVNADGPWLIEVAGRSIGGNCSRTLRFGSDASLEELILRQACGLPIASLSREGSAGGVMMIPIPEEGILRSVHGIEEATAIPGIEAVEISAPLHNPIVALPEGDSYLGFIFAHGEHPEEVEAALRAAHACLRFSIVPNVHLEIRL